LVATPQKLTQRTSRTATRIVAVLLLVNLAIFLYALGIGAYPLSYADIVARLFAGARLPSEEAEIILFQIRLPRLCAALMVGAALAAAGAMFQGIFRNPLVSPDILGVSTGAGLGASLGILLSWSVIAIQAFAFVGGLVTVALVYLVAGAVRGREPTLVLVLAGVVLGSLAGALISLVKILADPYDQLPAITFWLLGSLASISAADVRATLPAILLGLVPMVMLRWRVNILALGDEEARSLGVNPAQLRTILVMAATLMTAAAVAIAGVIGWIGLIIPHMARLLVGPNFSVLLPTSLLLGAGYLVLVDMLARSLSATETPLGILTAFLGAPLFLWLLARGKRGW
jgi:iron complex transport system permease protein